MAAYKRNNKIYDMRLPYFMASLDYGFGQYGLGSYLYDYSTMRVILFIPDDGKEVPVFPIKHRLYPLKSKEQ